MNKQTDFVLFWSKPRGGLLSDWFVNAKSTATVIIIRINNIHQIKSNNLIYCSWYMWLLDRAVEETATLWVIFQNHTVFLPSTSEAVTVNVSDPQHAEVWAGMDGILLFFFTSDLWVMFIHTLPAKLQAAMLSVLFCQSLITAMVFCRDCPKSRLNVNFLCKIVLWELWGNVKKETKI